MAVNSSDSWYAGLLGLADGFLNSKPPKIKETIQCLQAVFQFHPSPAIQARTHIQIGRLLSKYTKNSDLARTHLEKAVSFCMLVFRDLVRTFGFYCLGINRAFELLSIALSVKLFGHSRLDLVLIEVVCVLLCFCLCNL